MRGLLPLIILLFAAFLADPVQAQNLGQPSPQEEEAATEPVPVDRVPDEQVEERVSTVLRRIESFDDVSVDVADGVAVLDGEVQNAQDREQLTDLVNRFEGIIWVDNRVEVATDVQTRLTPALERLRRFGERALAFLPVGILVVLLMWILWKAGSLLSRWEAPATRFGWNPLVWALFRRVSRAVIVLAGLLLIFDILGVSAMVGALLGTAGVVGLALGFAFQDIAENYLAGVLMSIRQPFGVNDLVRIGEHEGHVLRLTSRELVLLTFEGNHVRLPNSTVFKSTLTNYSRNTRRRFHFDIGIGMDEDLTQVATIGRDVMASMRGVMNDPPPFVRTMEIGDSSVTMRFHGWVDQKDTDYYKVRSEALRLVKEAFDAAEIDVPDPRYMVRIRQDGEEKPKRARAASQEADVTPDRKLDAQIEEDLASSDEENLLRDETTKTRRG